MTDSIGQPLLSIVVIGFNIEQYLEECFTSIPTEVQSDVEVIYVDDGSSDNSVNIAKQHLHRFPRSKVVVQENRRAGGARNTGISEAAGRFLTFIDGDDFFANNGVGLLLEVCRHRTFDYSVSNRYRYFESTGECIKEPKSYGAYEGNPEGMANIFLTIAVHGKLYRRDFLLSKNIRFPEKIAVEDFAFHYQVCGHAEQIISVPDYTYVYRKRAGENKSLTQDRCSEFALASRFKQISLTRELVDELDMQARFPYFSFYNVDYERRLLRHLRPLSDSPDSDFRHKALESISRFLASEKENWIHAVSASTRAVYVDLVRHDYSAALERLRASGKKVQKQKVRDVTLGYRIVKAHVGPQRSEDFVLIELEHPLLMASNAGPGKRQYWKAKGAGGGVQLIREGNTPIHLFYVKAEGWKLLDRGELQIPKKSTRNLSQKRLVAWRLLWSWGFRRRSSAPVLKLLGPLYRKTVQ